MIVIFDLDGTIANSIQDLANAVNYGLKQLGYPEHDTEKYKQMVGNGAKKLCYRALPDDKKDDAEKLHAIFKAYYSEHYLDNTKIYDGIQKLIHNIFTYGRPVAVATNKPQDVARKIVEKLIPPIYSKYITVLGSCDERARKPDPAIINEIVVKYPDFNDSVVMIGDSNVDIQTAKNAGVHSIGCTWGFRTREELEKEGAEFIVDSPEQIMDIIYDLEFPDDIPYKK
ncbi:MAG: HAD family hydrolase [Ruminococcus sp.]|nr:HAD family hydrolase [Ruminococcus sp.]